MTRIIQSVHLSDIQKEVLAKIKASPNPHLAWEAISNAEDDIDNNFAAAKQMLVDLQLVIDDNDGLEVTQKGLEVMADEGLADESGELTPDGQQVAGISRDEVVQPGQQQQEQPPGEDPMGATGNDELGLGDDGEFGEEMPEDEVEPPMESIKSLSMIKMLNEDAALLDEIRKII